jgi:hypothetical protein
VKHTHGRILGGGKFLNKNIENGRFLIHVRTCMMVLRERERKISVYMRETKRKREGKKDLTLNLKMT